jgi:hypothetical protein
VAAIEHQGGGIVGKVLSDEPSRAEVEAFLDDSKSSVTRMLDEHRHVVEALRDALLVRSELIGDEILEVIGRAVADPDILPANLRDRPRRPAWHVTSGGVGVTDHPADATGGRRDLRSD